MMMKVNNDHMDPKMKEAIHDLLGSKDINEDVKQILDLALEMDDRGEYWKILQVFGEGS
jgi:DNA-binding transcriptional regulator GbsR (MarR family)